MIGLSTTLFIIGWAATALAVVALIWLLRCTNIKQFDIHDRTDPEQGDKP